MPEFITDEERSFFQVIVLAHPWFLEEDLEYLDDEKTSIISDSTIGGPKSYLRRNVSFAMVPMLLN